MTDPRDPLADCDCVVPHEEQVKHLAERGVLLVTEPMVAAALHADICDGSASHHHGDCKGQAAAIFAALSAGEADHDWTWGADKKGVESYNGPQGVGSWKAGTDD